MKIFTDIAQVLQQALDAVDAVCADYSMMLDILAEAAYHEELYATAEFRANLFDQDAPFEDYN